MWNDYHRISSQRLGTKHPQAVVSDQSFAQLHALCRAFGHGLLQTYLYSAFHSMTADRPLTQPILTGCASHYISNLNKAMSRLIPDKTNRQCFLHCFVNLFFATSLLEARNTWKDILKAFDQNDAEARKRLLNRNNNVTSHIEAAEENDHDDQCLDYESLKASSPFFHFFREGGQCAQSPATKYVEDNCLPFFPLWSELALKGTELKYQTNAVIESWFR